MTGESSCPCLVTREELDSAFALCRAECALHRQKAIQLIENAKTQVCEEASEESESALEKAIASIKSEIKDLKVGQSEIKKAHEDSEKEHKDFYRNVIYVLFGMLGTIAVGFITLFLSSGGIV